MGNEPNSIHQQPTSPELTQSKTFVSGLAHRPKNHTRPKSVSLGVDTKKSLAKAITDPRNCCIAKTFVTDAKQKDDGKIGKSNSPMDSLISKLIESSFEDSSSIIAIERLAKNCKLMAPSHLQSVEYARAAAREWRAKRKQSEEQKRGIDFQEYSPSDQQRSQPSAKSVLNDFLLFTNDELALDDIYEHGKSTDRFSFGDTSNYPKYPSFLDNDGSKISTTPGSELSSSGTPFNISLPRLDCHHPTDSVAISWPQGASPEESVKHPKGRKCLTCAIYTGNDKGLMQPEYRQQALRVDFKSKLSTGSDLLGVLPAGKQYSATRNQKLPKLVKPNPQATSSTKVVTLD